MTDPVPVNLGEQIAEVRREIAMRHVVYPRLVSFKRLEQAEATKRIARMEAVLRTLTELNEPGLALEQQLRPMPPPAAPLRPVGKS